MFTISIAFRTAPTPWRLIFKTKEAGEKAWAETTQEKFAIKDDYGQILEGCNADIAAKLFEDATESAQAAIELTLNNWRVEAEARKRAETDPRLRIARNPAAMLQPMPGLPQGNSRIF